MESNRRKFLKASLASVGAISIAGCSLLENVPNINYSGHVNTKEPLVKGINLSEFYPTEYSADVHSGNFESILRSEYIEQEVYRIQNPFEEADFSKESMIIFGKYMPMNLRLRLNDSYMEDGRIVFSYDITDGGGPNDVAIDTRVQRIESNIEDTDIIHRVEY